jgi:PIN domain nuclease of toxin-antitoxin system
MKLLLDTHILLWWLASPEELIPTALKAISNPTNEVYVSAASLWEMSIKQHLGKLSLPGNPIDILASMGFTMLDISAEHGWRAGDLPPHHKDPFDRMLVAQADIESMVLVTRDTHIPKYGIPILPA